MEGNDATEPQELDAAMADLTVGAPCTHSRFGAGFRSLLLSPSLARSAPLELNAVLCLHGRAAVRVCRHAGWREQPSDD